MNDIVMHMYYLLKKKEIFVRMEGQTVTTVMILSFRTDRSGKTVQTQIRQLLEEQSDQRLDCLPFCLHLLNALLYGKAALFKF